MTYKGFFVDDEDSIYAETLSIDDKLEFEFLPVSEVSNLAREIVAATPAVVAIDYRLDEVSNGVAAPQTFKGSALAQQLRDSAVEQPQLDFAVVLVSAEENIRKFFQPDITAHDLFDRVYVKGHLIDHGDRIKAELLSLCEGYEKLRSSVGHFDLAILTNADESDLEFLDAQELRVRVSDARAPHHVSRAFFSFLINRSGVLISTGDLCALLGVEVSHATDLEALLGTEALSYTGLFSGISPRWWSNRVNAWAQQVFERRPSGLTSGERAKRLSERFGQSFAPALSPWSGSDTEIIAVPCACCSRGVELRHTVAAYEHALPRFLARRRICWDCIQLDKLQGILPPLIVDELDMSLAEKVKFLGRDEASEDKVE
jgi:hypothetical protein